MKTLTKLLILVAGSCCLWLQSQSVDLSSFGPTQTLSIGETAKSIAIGDLNNDGASDLVWIDQFDVIKYRLGTRNLTKLAGGTPTSSQSAEPPEYAFVDNSSGDYWSSPHMDHDDEWVQWDFGAANAQLIRKIRIKHFRNNGGLGIFNFTFEGSDDESLWHPLVSGTFDLTTQNNQLTTHGFPSNNTAYRYFRLSMSNLNAPSLYNPNGYHPRCVVRQVELLAE